jgi:hypothetical protein
LRGSAQRTPYVVPPGSLILSPNGAASNACCAPFAARVPNHAVTTIAPARELSFRVMISCSHQIALLRYASNFESHNAAAD